MLDAEFPFPLYPSLTGAPLQNGVAYYGVAGANPVTTPVTVYWDAAGTQPASQPIKIVNGMPTRNGAPARLWTSGDFSRLVADAAGRTVLYDPHQPSALASNLAAATGASLVGFQNIAAGGVPRNVLSKLLDVISVKDYGAIGDGNSHPLSAVYPTLAAAQVVYPHATALTDEIDWCAFQAAANYAVGLPNGCAIIVPAGKYLCKKVTYDAIANAGGKPLWVGDGSGYSRIVHVDGASEPLFYVTGAGTGLSAYPWGGWSGLRFEAGTLTTDLIKFDGAIDNQTLFEDLQFNGTNGTTGALCNGLSIRDFLNLRISRVRWDAIAGWGINVRQCLSAFGRTSMSIREFSYDNQQVGPRGRGFINCDATAAGDGRVALIDLDDGTIELNAALEAAAPERCLIKFENSNASTGFILPQGRVSLNSVQFQGNVSVGRNFRCLGNTWGELAIICENVTVLNFKQFYDNDQGNAAGAVQGNIPNLVFIPQMSGGELNGGDSTRNQLVDRFAGVGVGAVRDDAKLTTSSYFRRGDWAQFVNPNQAAIGRPFAYKAVQEQAGICANFDTGAIGTAAINTGSATLVFTATIPDRCLPGFAVEVLGAGAAGASLFAKVLFANTDTNTVTLDTPAATTVAAAGVKVARAQVMAVEMLTYSAGVPTLGAYKVGDIARNTNFNGGSAPVSEYACTGAGTPGVWRATKWITGKGVTGSRPALGVSDVGVQYLDQTLNANGKPITWTGSAWVDSTGAVV